MFETRLINVFTGEILQKVNNRGTEEILYQKNTTGTTTRCR